MKISEWRICMSLQNNLKKYLWYVKIIVQVKSKRLLALLISLGTITPSFKAKHFKDLNIYLVVHTVS